MTAMGKVDMIRLFIYPPPGDFLPLLLRLPDFFFFRAFCDGVLMAVYAEIEVGHAGEGLGFEEAVASLTPQSLIHMLFVIERNRLLGLGAKTEADEDEE